MSVPLILREAAEEDIRHIHGGYETIRTGLGDLFVSRLREMLSQIESIPEIHGIIWKDIRAARLRQFNHVVYYVVFSNRVEVLAVIHGSRHPSTWISRA